MPKPPVAWFHSLADSVFALGAAAREYRTANQAARVAAWNADPFRLVPAEGALKVPGKGSIRPHDDALTRLARLYGDLESRAKDLYENTALAYAYGTAGALQSVLKGETPPYVQLRRHDGRYVLHDSLLPDLRDALAEWSGNERLAALRESVASRECADAFANGLAASQYLADREAADLAKASEFATGLADCAYAYGEQSESALHFLLMAAAAGHIPKENQ
ncbi:hypothetical protein ACTPOK_20060 [Streptomyces inhibens]|uniref:hypothetical protein n=1 Tax=Streptomyces inhibens TaxID=2293571 RepID=UPI00402ADE85